MGVSIGGGCGSGVMTKHRIESGFRVEPDLQGDLDHRFLRRRDQHPLGTFDAVEVDEIIEAGAQVLVDHLGDVMRFLFDLLTEFPLLRQREQLGKRRFGERPSAVLCAADTWLLPPASVGHSFPSATNRGAKLQRKGCSSP